MCRIPVLFLALLSHVEAATQLFLGMIYVHGSAESYSWAVETWSHFKLAVQDVNAQGFLPAGYVLNYTVADTQSSSTAALQAAISMIANSQIIGIVGTENGPAAAVATYATSAQVPMMSPGSTLADLQSKSNFPFFMRSIANDGTQMKAAAALVGWMNWRRAAVTSNSNCNARTMLSALDALSVQYLSLVYQDIGAAPSQSAIDKVQDTFKLLKSSGYRVLLFYPYTADVPYIASFGNASGLFSQQYVWVVMEAGCAGALATSPSAVFVKIYLSANPLYTAYAARWPTVSTTYDCNRDGEWNSTTDMPFWGSNIYSGPIFDTDYACTGDGQPDSFGIYGYDAVWIFATAIKTLLLAGILPTNASFGPSLKDTILASTYTGITGTTVFDQVSQDRASVQSYWMGGPSLQLFGITTNNLNQGDPEKMPGSWCVSGCVNQTAFPVPWPWGVPTDGRALDPSLSSMSTASSVEEKAALQVTVVMRDSFGRIPCSADCADQNSTACAYCRGTILNLGSLVLVGTSWATGQVLTPAAPTVQTVDYNGGQAVLTLPSGFREDHIEDRYISVAAMQSGNVIGAAANVTLKSLSCLHGQFGTGHGARHRLGTGCDVCGPGTVSSKRGMLACEPCLPGSFMDLSGRSRCLPCAVGTSAPANGSSSCQPCPKGTFTGVTGSSACTPCPSGMTTAILGATALDSCICSQGNYRSAAGPCQPCPDGMSCVEGSDERAFGGANRSLLSNSSYALAPYPQVLPGYWTAANAPLSVYQCKTSAAFCSGGPPQTCGGDLGGISCARCTPNHFLSGDACSPCDSPGLNVFLFPILPILLSFVVAFALYRLSRGGVLVADWNTPAGALGILGSLFARHAQVLGIYAGLNLKLIDFQKNFSGPFQAFMNPLHLFRKECLGLASFEADLIVGLLTPSYLFVIFVLVYLIAFAISLVWSKARLDTNTLIGTYGSQYLGFFTSVSALALSVFSCYPNPNGTSSVSTANDLLCGSGEWNSMVIMNVFAVLLYCCGAFTLVSYVCWFAGANLSDEAFRKKWKFLLVHYRDGYVWWNLVVLAEGFLLNLGQVLLSSGAQQIYLVQMVLGLAAFCCEKYQPWRHVLVNDIDALLRVYEVLYGTVMMRFVQESAGTGEAIWGMVLQFIPYGICVVFGILKASTIAEVKLCPGRRAHLVLPDDSASLWTKSNSLRRSGSMQSVAGDGGDAHKAEEEAEDEDAADRAVAAHICEAYSTFGVLEWKDVKQVYKVLSETERRILNTAAAVILRGMEIGLAPEDATPAEEALDANRAQAGQEATVPALVLDVDSLDLPQITQDLLQVIDARLSNLSRGGSPRSSLTVDDERVFAL